MPELPVSNPATLVAARRTALCLPFALLVGALACTPKSEEKALSETTGTKAKTFTVSDSQRQRLRIITLSPETFHPTIEATGTVVFNGDRSTTVLSAISGPVIRIDVTLGTSVKPGQTLATVSSPDFASAVATYRKAEETVRNTTRIFTLDEKLFANDAIARSDLDQARTDAADAVADRDAAIEQMRALGVDDATIQGLKDGKQVTRVEGAVKAPIPGVVVEKLITPGQLLQAGMTPTFTVADLSTMWVLASVYGADIGAVAAGQTAEVITDASPAPVQARVDYVAPIVDPGTKATTVRLVTNNPSALLKRDMFVQVRIHSTRERRGVLVPTSSVLRDEDNLPFVFVSNADRSFSRRRVTLGARVKDRYEITSGLTAGERVLADGALFVQFAESQ